MNRQEVENNKLFWKMVNYIESCSDKVVENHQGVAIERGKVLNYDYSILFGLDDGVVRIYDDKERVIATFDENNKYLSILKDIFNDLEC